MKSKSYFILTLLLLLSVQLNAGWQRPVTNYTRHTYKAGNQNWMLQQHDNGWMYVANSNGLLEFDGASWNLYPIRNAKARAMRIGNDGRIYIGGIGWFGYFTPNRLGGLVELRWNNPSRHSDRNACNLYTRLLRTVGKG